MQRQGTSCSHGAEDDKTEKCRTSLTWPYRDAFVDKSAMIEQAPAKPAHIEQKVRRDNRKGSDDNHRSTANRRTIAHLRRPTPCYEENNTDCAAPPNARL